MAKLRKSFYRALNKTLVQRLILPWWVSGERLLAGVSGIGAVPTRIPRKRRAWFHAASVGELESLLPVIEAWAARGDELLVTVLSESAQKQVEKLRQGLDGKPGKVLFAGFSPWEGRWGDALREASPDVFVTAKYEAWPELWLSLAEQRIPLVIVSCRARRSLLLARGVCRALGGAVPRLSLLAVHEGDAERLRGLFPSAQVKAVGEPRWDRVYARARAGNPRSAELVREFRDSPRPWGVLGSAWASDIEVWKLCLSTWGDLSGLGTLWVVPHKVDEGTTAEIEGMLRGLGANPERTRSAEATVPGSPPATCILVNEMGALSELYAAADWAFVGGGFGTGPKGTTLHSTIEPALYGIPVSGGPHGAAKFAEVAELGRTGQLRIVSGPDELREWLVGVQTEDAASRRRRSEAWKEEVRRRLGAPGRILDAMDEAMAESRAAC